MENFLTNYFFSLFHIVSFFIIGSIASIIINRSLPKTSFKPLFWGGLLYASLVAIYKTNFNSIFLITATLTIYHIWISRKDEKGNKKDIFQNISYLLGFHLIIFSITFILNIDLLTNEFYIPTYDQITFSNIIKLLGKGYGENATLDWLDPKNHAYPYHYWEFWLVSPTSIFFDIPIYKLFYTIQLSYFGTLILLIGFEIASKVSVLKFKKYAPLLALSLIFISSKPLSYLFGDPLALGQYYGLTVILSDKYNIIVIFCLISLYYFIRNEKYNIFITLSILATVYPTAAPALISSLILIGLFKKPKETLVYSIPIITTGLAVFLFFLFQPKDLNNISFLQEKISAFNAGMAFKIALGNILKGGIFLIIPVITYLAVPTLRKELIKLTLFLALTIIFASCFWALTHTFWLDSIQFAQTVISTVTLVILFYCLLLLINHSSKFLSFAVLALLLSLSVLNLVNNAPPEEAVEKSKIAALQNYFQDKEVFGLFTRDTKKNKSLHFKNVNFFWPIKDLYLIKNINPLICINSNSFSSTETYLKGYELELIHNNAFQNYNRKKTGRGLEELLRTKNINLFIIENSYFDPKVDYNFIKSQFKFQMKYGPHLLFYN